VQFFKVSTPDAVAKAWMRLIVKKALPLDLVDDRFFREAVEMTAKSGSKNMIVELAADLAKEDRPLGGTELLKSCDTRFASNVMMLIRYRNVHNLLETLVIDKVYVEWCRSSPAR